MTDLSTPTRRETPEEDRASDVARSRALRKEVSKDFFQGQFWFILKNVIGWTLMIIAWPVGVALPGPGGVPLFILGFALASIPGKRKITSHVMRGRPIQVRPMPYVIVATIVSVLAVLLLMWLIHRHREGLLDAFKLRDNTHAQVVSIVVGVAVVGVIVCWGAVKLGIVSVNLLLRGLPKARRKLRPWLKSHGVHLLPRRRKHEDGVTTNVNENEIIELDQTGREKLKALGKWCLRWGVRALALGVVAFVIWRILKPAIHQ